MEFKCESSNQSVCCFPRENSSGSVGVEELRIRVQRWCTSSSAFNCHSLYRPGSDKGNPGKSLSVPELNGKDGCEREWKLEQREKMGVSPLHTLLHDWRQQHKPKPHCIAFHICCQPEAAVWCFSVLSLFENPGMLCWSEDDMTASSWVIKAVGLCVLCYVNCDVNEIETW